MLKIDHAEDTIDILNYGTVFTIFFYNSTVGKWTLTYEQWPWSQYHPYLLGGAVLIPQITILPLLAAFQTTPLIPFEDVYLSGMCSEKAGIKLHFSSKTFRYVGFVF